MLTVHHLNNSRSQRVLWLLEELGVEYEIQRYQRDAKTMLAPPELLSVHPLGKSPVLTDDDVTVAESGAIIEYLLDKYGDGRLVPPPGTEARRRSRYRRRRPCRRGRRPAPAARSRRAGSHRRGLSALP